MSKSNKNSEGPQYSFFYQYSKRVCHAFCSAYFDFCAYNVHNVPTEGAFLLAANHRSFIDPPLAGISIKPDMYYFARKTLFKGKFGNWFFRKLNCIPVDTKGSSNVNALKSVLAALNSGKSLTIFPEGTRSPTDDFLPAKAGVGMMACRAQVPVIPVHIFGVYNAWPKHSLFPKFKSKVTVVYGKPLLPSDYDPGKQDKNRYQVASQFILEKIKEIEDPEHSLT